jgi:polysaccharide biosynthesis protein PslH
MLANKPKVLFLTHRLPYPPDRGDRIRSFHMIRFLSQFCDLHLGSLADEPWQPDQVSFLETLCEEVKVFRLGPRYRWLMASARFATGGAITEGAFFSRELANQVSRWTSQRFDGALVFCSSMGQYIDCFSKRPTRIVLDLVDVDSQKWHDYAAKAKAPKSWLYFLEAARISQLERRLASAVDETLVVSPDEANLFATRHPGMTATSVGNGVDLDYFSPDAALAFASPDLHPRAPQMVFVGVLDYLPNSQGLHWFCNQVMPQLRKKLPGAHLRIVGRSPPADVVALGRLPGVEVVGQVPDVRPYLLSSHFAIAPLQIARGVQNKVLEALACGRPVVATPQAATGIEVSEGIVVASDPSEWVRAIEQIMVPTIYAQKAKMARQQSVEHYSWEARLLPLLSLLGVDS